MNTLSPRRVGKIGSSMVAALFDRSPYLTKLGLYNHFALETEIDRDPDERMNWGKRLQDDILEAVQEDRGWDLVPKGDDDWLDHPDPTLRCGATIDSEVINHGKGLGVVECKNVDRMIWLQTWTATTAPPHIELQLQHQLFVTGAKWGAIAALVGGNELHIVERDALPALHGRIAAALRTFWGQVAAKTPPDALGLPEELPDLATLYPETIPDPVLEMFGDRHAADLVDAVREYLWSIDRAKEAKDIGDRAKATLLAATREYQVTRTHGYRIQVDKSPTKATQIALPKKVRDALAEMAADVGNPHAAVVGEAAEWTVTTRAASIQTRIKITEVAGDPPAPDLLDMAMAEAATAQYGG